VERSVEYIRRKVFAFKDDFKTLAEAQAYLLDRVSELNQRPGKDVADSPAAKLELERGGLHAHPGRMECFAGENYRVDKYSTICFGTNRYSVPDHFIGKMVFVKIYSESLRIYDANRVLCQHQRLYERHSWQIDLNHYLVTLQRKPGAVAGAIALQQAPEWIRSMYADHFTHDSRSFIELLQYCQLNSVDHQQLKAAIHQLSHPLSADILVQHVMALLGNHAEELPICGQQPDPIMLQSLENLMELASMMQCN
jgi:hypothetical protein